MNVIETLKSIYYSEDESEDILLDIRKKLNSDINNISHEMLCIFYDVLNKEPSCYFNKSIHDKIYNELERLCNCNNIIVSEEILEHFFIGYNTYKQITDIINDLSQLNDNPEIKNRMYRIPTYISIVEGCLTNLFRVIILILDQTTEKKLAPNKKLKPICDILISNSLDILVKDIDINIRNAINHGSVVFTNGGEELEFFYNEKNMVVNMSMKTYEFDNLINKTYDAASGVLLGICSFMNNHIDLIDISKMEKSFVIFSLLGMELSIPSVRFKSISELPDNKQLNVNINVEDTRISYITRLVTILAMIIYNRYSDYKKYVIFFGNERMQSGWINFTNENITEMIYGKKSYEEVLQDIIKNNEVIFFEPSNEEINLHEIKYHRFPNYTGKDFKINNINDASVKDRKRLKANLYINDVEEKEKILEIIYKAIDWLKDIKNVASPKFRVKHGDMEADSLYINVYRNDRRGSKELFSNNNNFVCFVDYNINGETTLVDGGLPKGIWNNLNHEKINNIKIAWRERKYKTVKNFIKISRNDLCSCGSGRKYKKCCINKNIF